MARTFALPGLVLGNLIISTAWIALRFDTSAAIERPLHLTISTLLLAGTIWTVLSRRRKSYDDDAAVPKYEVSQHNKELPEPASQQPTSSRHGRFQGSSVVVVALVVIRALLFRVVVRYVECSWDGVESFLPLLIVAYDFLFQRTDSKSASAQSRLLVFTTIIFALIAGFAPLDRSSYICARKTWQFPVVPFLQLLGLLIDSSLVVSVTALVKEVEYHEVVTRLGRLSLLAASSISALSAIYLATHQDMIIQSTHLDPSLAFEILSMGFLGASALVSAAYLLRDHNATTITIITTSVAVYFSSLKQQRVHLLGSHGGWFAIMSFALLGVLYSLLHNGRQQSLSGRRGGIEESATRVLTLFGILVAGLLIVFPSRILFSQSSHNLGFQPLQKLIKAAPAKSSQWLYQAESSRSLTDAVKEYRKRYGIPPPPNFDKWYQFAISRGSVVIDSFDQIHQDLLPFWGFSPAQIQQSTAHLLDRPWTEVAGVRISNGTAQVGTHVRPTHRWMVEGAVDMINTFAKWLPDMDLAFNLNDESRVVIPYSEMEIMLQKALTSRKRLDNSTMYQPFSNNPSAWESRFMGEEELDDKEASQYFYEASIAPAFDDFSSISCPPQSFSRRWKWWNKKAVCHACSYPHTLGPFISNWTLSGSPCHQPDLAHLHGFHLSPSAFKVTKRLFPIFSQSKVPGYSDILYPSPWNYKDKVSYDSNKDMIFVMKDNTFFWRGATSEGYSRGGAWQGMQRQRFVHLLNQPSPNPETTRFRPITTNASFVSEPQRCDDCAVELSNLPFSEPVDFQSHWSHRYLLDMDGAGFSGRFLPFLQSQSLVFRAASFRQWFEDRLEPWRHYIPLDVRGNEIWKLVRYFNTADGHNDAESIAMEGKRMAEKVLRKEDMEVYMFRLLLEWGRVVDSRREELGFGFNG